MGHGEWIGSRANLNEQGMIHPGADDNASGVACMLEVAKGLSELKSQGALSGNKDIVIAAWSGEELGVLGSSYFVNNLAKNSASHTMSLPIEALINLDMVGHLSKTLILQGIGSSAEWRGILKQIPLDHSVSVSLQDDPYLPTDTTPFYLHGIPIINFFSGAHADYHTPRDTAQTLNYQGMHQISRFIMHLIVTLENAPTSLVYQSVKKPYLSYNKRFRAYLGTIPDYASSEILGVKLSGVIKESPAQQAGLEANDIIVQLNGKKIKNINDYMDGLNTLPLGKSVPLIALRDNKKKIFVVVAKAR